MTNDVSRKLLLVALLLLAFTLRLHDLNQIPPGLTHDEANHGREAIGVLDGDLRYYFPLNYGSEPVYSYTVAGGMAALGENLFALRFVNVIFGLLTIALLYRWVRRVLGGDVAMLTAGLLAVSFWPLASSRQALRAGMLPFFMTGAVWFFWSFFKKRNAKGQRGKGAKNKNVSSEGTLSEGRLPFTDYRPLITVLAFSLCLLITLHIYLAARVAWLIFPLFLLYLALANREALRRIWRPTLAGLLLTAVLVTPMFIYLRHNPQVQPRLSMLDAPLEALRSGQWGPIFGNVRDALLAFIWPGYGDQFLAYNIPGRPVFEPVTAVFFLIGLVLALATVFGGQYSVFGGQYSVFGKRRSLITDNRPLITDNPSLITVREAVAQRHHPLSFLLLWVLVGISPSLVTGPTANTTRNLAALPAVYVFAAVGFVALAGWVRRRLPTWGNRAVAGLAVAWLAVAGIGAGRDYFIRWGPSPQVRGAYQHTLTQMLDYLKEETAVSPPAPGPATLISTVYPGPAHDPSLALVLAPRLSLRWVDARYALLFPGGGGSDAIIPRSTTPHPIFAAWLTPLHTVSLRPDDLDPSFTYYQLAPPNLGAMDETAVAPIATFNQALTLLHARWITPPTAPGGTAQLLTAWRVEDASRVGPLVPPFDASDLVLFTQVLDDADQVLTQRDALDAPSWDWGTEDVILQIHPLTAPPDAASGAYRTIVGVYDRLSGQRLPVTAAAGDAGESYMPVSPLRIDDSAN